ncbi:MAG: polysaccharide pyruvyl transferase family protein [Flavobacterium sp.]|nr:MAG: polysaccharide pyruvyl transferase family protein [Flavobacterium sp.]
MSNKPIPLFYWSSKIFENKVYENYGDLLSKYIVEKLSGRTTVYYNAPKSRKRLFKPRHLLAIGSIMSYADGRSYVWGTGIISKNDVFGKATFCAVRGPKTRERVIQLGFECPEVYGDPALLLPRFYKPVVAKTHKIGIIPHYTDYDTVARWYKNSPGIKVINLLSDDLEATTNDILSCESTISSSLHGIIISHAYGIPSVWVRFSNRLSGDNVKFEDYFLSVDLVPYTGTNIEQPQSAAELEKLISKQQNVVESSKLEEICDNLKESFPKL